MSQPASHVHDDCVFCTRHDQPDILFETPSLYVMPDKFPMRPGHTLIISKEHRRCYAQAPLDVLCELDEAAARVRTFLEEAYGEPVLAYENGVAGQSVFHAHLHLQPARISRLPDGLEEHEDITRISGWEQVQQHFARHGHYRYIEVGGARWIIAGFSPVIETMRRVMAEATDLVWGDHGWVKTTTPEDVREVNRRWIWWASGRLGR